MTLSEIESFKNRKKSVWHQQHKKRCTVKITIDTTRDSHEDIRKVIGLLSTMIDAANGTFPTPRAEPPTPEQSESLFDIFDTPQRTDTPERKPETGNEGDKERFKVDGLELY